MYIDLQAMTIGDRTWSYNQQKTINKETAFFSFFLSHNDGWFAGPQRAGGRATELRRMFGLTPSPPHPSRR